MFPGMTEELIVYKLAADKQQQAMEMQQVKQAIAASQAAGAMSGGATGKGGDWHQGQGAWEQGWKGGNGRVVLDEKYFRRCGKFDGAPAKIKSWMFDLVTAVGSVDQSLATKFKFITTLSLAKT